MSNAPQDSHRPSIRLFTPDRHDEPIETAPPAGVMQTPVAPSHAAADRTLLPAGAVVSPDSDLRGFFEGYFWPVLGRRLSRRTRREYLATLAWWESLTTNPGIVAISDDHLAGFEQSLSQSKHLGKTLSPTTVRKHFAQLGKLLRTAGPKGHGNRRGAGILADVPDVELPRLGDERLIDTLPLDALDRIYDACEIAVVPRLEWIDAPSWWRSMFCVDYQTALRIGSLIYTDWCWIDAVRRTIRVPGVHYKGGRSHVFALNEIALSTFDRLRTMQQAGGAYNATPFGERVWVWPHDPDTAQHPGDVRWHNPDLSYLQKVRRQIFAKAGIDPSIGGFHALRRANATNRPLVQLHDSQKALGHAAGATTDQHYIGQAVRQAVVDGLPQPSRFIEEQQQREAGG